MPSVLAWPMRRCPSSLSRSGQLWRYSIHTHTGTVERELLHPGTCDFPIFNPANEGRPYRYVYLASAPADQQRSFVQAIVKLDLETGDTCWWNATPHGFPGEALFVAKGGASANGSQTAEDAGWLLSLVYDGEHHRTDVVILDAQNLGQGPLARLHLKQHLPHGFHGCFVADYFGPA